MSDIVQKSTEYRIKQIEIAEANYYKSLVKALDKIEREVVALVNKDLRRTTDGKLIELQTAIAIRPKIKAILDKRIFSLVRYSCKRGFYKTSKENRKKHLKELGNIPGRIPKEFQELTKGDLALVKNLKQQYFTQFKDVSNTFTRRLSEKVYQNVLVGNDFTELEKELKTNNKWYLR